MADFIIKSSGIPNLAHGQYPGSRSIEELIKSGIIILDKWPGPTSHDVAATVKKIFSLNKVGHSGTLDPSVSGILPITLGNACKVIPALQHLDKEYVGVMHLHKDVSDNALQETIKKFTGRITQLPPVRSAVARRERQRSIYSFKVLERKEKNVLFQVSCEAGTYVRKLVSDVGREIGGAHMLELRRTKVGRFSEPVKMQDVVDAYHAWKETGDESMRDFVLPVESAVEHLGKIIVKDSAVAAVSNGSPLYTGGISRVQKGIHKGELIAILTLRGELVALANATLASEEMKRKSMAAKIDRVIMEKGAYAE